MASVLRGCAVPRPVLRPRQEERVWTGDTQEASRQQEEPGVTLDGGHWRLVGIQFHAPAPWRRAVRGHPLPDAPGRSLMGRQLLTPRRRRGD